MPKTIRPLTMKEIEALTSTKAIGGAPGLFCDVQKTATGYSRSYFLRYRGKRYTIGSIKRVTLKEARTTASAYREEIDRGGNPTERKRAARAPQSKPLTLAELFDWHMVHRLEKDKIKEKDEKTTRSRFARFIPEELKEKAAAEITPQDITNGIEKAWLNTHESARRLLLEMEGAYSRGMLCGKLPAMQNPAQLRQVLQHTLPKVTRDANDHHHPALRPEEVPEFIAALMAGKRQLDASKGFIIYAILTAGRAASALQAQDKEIDWGNKIHRIPREDGRMKIKGGGDRQTPLNKEALHVLRSVPHTEGVPYLFESSSSRCRGKPISVGAYEQALKRFHAEQGGRWVDPWLKGPNEKPRNATLHGIARASFKDWAKDGKAYGHAPFPEALIERCLDHREKYGGAYDRREPVEEMRAVFDAWGAFCFSKVYALAKAAEAPEKEE